VDGEPQRRDLQLGQDVAQVLDGARPALPAVADERGRLAAQLSNDAMTSLHRFAAGVSIGRPRASAARRRTAAGDRDAL
jgi:hypothetical protein